MKTLLDSSFVSLHLMEDAASVIYAPDGLYVGQEPVIFSGLNEANSQIAENVTAPSDWLAGKYRLIDGVWQQNDDYVEQVDSTTEERALAAFNTERAAKLAATDWWAIRASEPGGVPMTEEQLAYRQALRVMDDAEDFDPFNPVWPLEPGA